MKKFFSLLLTLCLLSVSVGVCCAEEETVSLANWAGTWNSNESFLRDETVEAAIVAWGESFGMDGAGFAEMYKSMIAVDGVGSFVISDDSITAYTDQNGEGDELFSAKFVFVGVESLEGEMDGEPYKLDWYEFKLDGDGPAEYTYLILGEADTEAEDGLIHFHYRYGSESFDALINSEVNWLPTMIHPTVTPELFIASLSAEH